MSASEPNEQRICPDCGATLREEGNSCWICHLAIEEGVYAAAEPPAPFVAGARAPIAAGDKPVGVFESRAAYQFSLATIMLTITLVAVLLGVFRMAPGLGIVLLILVTPAFLRTCIVMARRKARGESISTADKLGSFALTLGIVVLLVPVVAVAIIVALIAICTAMMSVGALG